MLQPKPRGKVLHLALCLEVLLWVTALLLAGRAGEGVACYSQSQGERCCTWRCAFKYCSGSQHCLASSGGGGGGGKGGLVYRMI